MLVDSAGYHYFVNKKRETRMYWKCLKYRSHGCRARAVTEGFYIVSKTAEHSHEPPANVAANAAAAAAAAAVATTTTTVAVATADTNFETATVEFV